MIHRTLLTGILALGLALAPLAMAWADPLSDLKDQLICQCGCNLVLASCQDMMECGPAQQMTNEIIAWLEEGRPPGAIIGAFVARYGKAVLAAPPKEGFDLAAWVTPFAALLGGLILLYLIVRELVRQGRPEPTADPGLNVSDEERERLRETLREDLKDYI